MQDPYAQTKCHLENIFEELNNEKYTIFTNSKTYRYQDSIFLHLKFGLFIN